MFLKNIVTAGAFVGLMGSAAYAADCGPGGHAVKVLAGDFPAIHAIVGEAKNACAETASEFVINHTKEPRQIMNAALTPNPAEYTAVVATNATLTQLMNEGLVRPLNDLVEKYGANVKPHQLITIDGDVMAVAFMANSQHLFVRKDVLEQAGVTEMPKTFDDILAAAEKIRAAGIMEHPFTTNMQVGWNLGEVFNIIYLAHGGEFFEPGSAKPALMNDKGIATLELMKALMGYSSPDVMTFASNETQAQWEAGDAAMAIMWGSRGSTVLDDEGSTPEVTENTVLMASPMVAGMEIPAATLWWDGITIAKNVSDEDAEASFAALTSGMSAEMVAAHNDDAVWLLEGFTAGPAAAGVSATAQGGAKPYPMIPFMSLMHTAVGAEIVDYLKGDESAEQALADVEAAYTTAAKEQGFLD